MTGSVPQARRHFLARLVASVFGFWALPAAARTKPGDDFDIDVRLTPGGRQVAQFGTASAGCTATCGGSCLGTCGGTCEPTCYATCQASCSPTCADTCHCPNPQRP